MTITRFDDAKPYSAPGHSDMVAMLLQGRDVTPCDKFWVGMSTFLPGGGADWGSADNHKVYVVIEGTMTVRDKNSTFELGPNDSLHLAPGYEREIVNKTNYPVRMLVISEP